MTLRRFQAVRAPAWGAGLFLLLLTACVAASPPAPEGGVALADRWGIEIVSLRMSANDHMVDFRYRVLDPGTAAPLFARENKPYLIDEASGKVLAVPATAKVGPLRTSGDITAGKIYWMFFGNSQGLVRAGSKVTVVIGEFRAAGLVVQ